MAIVSYSAIDEITQDITASIPGPQDGESIFDYRARVNRRLMEIVDAISAHSRRVERFIRDHSDERLDETDQFYNAVRQRFITDEFEG